MNENIAHCDQLFSFFRFVLTIRQLMTVELLHHASCCNIELQWRTQRIPQPTSACKQCLYAKIKPIQKIKIIWICTILFVRYCIMFNRSLKKSFHVKAELTFLIFTSILCIAQTSIIARPLGATQQRGKIVTGWYSWNFERRALSCRFSRAF